ncbi:MAG: sigma-70 family RNA polymerase sigma factor [Deltaproteobacteria bacterium]|nr:MAG: sigma-70 family RNA polymerase sigma factor [Deltaproteobacteria bacterium]
MARTDKELVEALRAGDESAFAAVVSRHHDGLLRLARRMLPAAGVAEEVVQETWMAVLRGLARFEGRSSLKTWIYRILVNRARTRARREGRVLPFSAMGQEDDQPFEPERFDASGHWKEPPTDWDDSPQGMLMRKEVKAAILEAIETIPPRQAVVLRMRDLEGLSSEEVCNILEISETNQRVLLHRARHKVRTVLEHYLAGDSAP